MTFRRWAGTLAGLVAALASASTASGPSAIAAVAFEAGERSSEEEVDTLLLAEAMNVPIADLQFRLDLQSSMDSIDFRRLDPGYAEDGSTGLDGPFKLWYRSALKPSPELLDAMRNAGVLDHVDFVRVPRSADDLLAAARTTHDQVSSVTREVGLTIDTATGGVTLHATRMATSNDRKAAESVVAESGLPYVWDEAPTEPFIRGGQPVTVAGNACTAGFVVQTSGGNKGLSTAGHCATLGVGSPVYYNSTSGWEVKALDDDAFNDWARFDKPNQTFVAEVVYSNSGTIRDVTGTKLWSGMDVGDPVSKYGRSTGYTVGTISDKWACAPGACDPESLFVEVLPNSGYPDMCKGGDSGGPVMWNLTAYGLVTGGSGAGDCIFMPQQFMDPTVLTK